MSASGKPRVMVFYGLGENCHDETMYAYEKVGAEPEKVLYRSFLEDPKILRNFQISHYPGGFLHGDDLRAAKVMAFRMRKNDYVMEEIYRAIEEGKPTMGICNGFQLLVRLGILPGLKPRKEPEETLNYNDSGRSPGLNLLKEPEATLTYNDSGRFEDRWVKLDINGRGKCIWTTGIEMIELPVRHGEGNFTPRDDDVLERMEEEGLIVGRYLGKDGEINPAYPYNPNGSVSDIAMICDPTGLVVGSMPHPEAEIKRNHPRWTRGRLPKEGRGLEIFRNGVKFVKGEI
jgi:phosphoribosylformylglycinamidine synthase I